MEWRDRGKAALVARAVASFSGFADVQLTGTCRACSIFDPMRHLRHLPVCVIAFIGCSRVQGRVSIERCPDAGSPQAASPADEKTRVVPRCELFHGRLVAFLVMSTTEGAGDQVQPPVDLAYKIICNEAGECNGVSVRVPDVPQSNDREPRPFFASDPVNLGTGQVNRVGSSYTVSLEERPTNLGKSLFTIDLDTGLATFVNRTTHGTYARASGSCSSGLVKSQAEPKVRR